VSPPPPATKLGAPPTTLPPSSTEPLPPREERPAPVAKATHPRGIVHRPTRPAAGEAAAAERPAPAAVAERPPPKGDKLDDLLNSALGNKARPTAAARPREDEEPAARRPAAASLAKLEREDMVRGMQGVSGRVHECFNQYKVPGTAMVKINVARGGKVSGATVSGKFAGTPTGSCVESAVRTAHFPPVEAQNFDFPFALH
jgi:hypothetical protein